MLAIPAIDVMEGNVVRLFRGKRSLCKVYHSDPVKVAKEWIENGAELLHVVDLDAAFSNGDNVSIIREIVKLGAKVQVGGGIRDKNKVYQMIGMGVERIIIGTKATDKEFLKNLVSIYPEKIGVSVDVLDGKFMTGGWQEKTDYDFMDFMNYLQDQGVRWVIYTDISRDGTLRGVDIDTVSQLSSFSRMNIMVSGGINSYLELTKLKEKVPFIYGVIMGKVLYERIVDFKKARVLLE